MAPGLPKLNFTPKPVKSQASQGMSTQVKATGSSTRGVGSQVGRLSQTGTMSLFGIEAQRSNRLIGNVKAGYGPGISRLRHGLNDYRYRMDDFWTRPSLASANHNSGMSDIQKLMELQMLMGGINSLAGGAAGIISAVKSNKSSSTNNTQKAAEPEVNNTKKDDVPTQNGKVSKTPSETEKVNTAVTSSLDGMKKAKDVSSLETMISAAETNLSTVNSNYEKENGELSQLNSKTSTFEANVKTAKDNLDANTKAIEKQTPEVSRLLQNYKTLQSTYDAMPTATAEQRTAKNQFMEKVLAAKQEYEKAQAELDRLKGQTDGLKEAKTQADNDLKEHKAQIETKEKNVKSLQDNKSKLEKEIKQQKTRLEKLKQESTNATNSQKSGNSTVDFVDDVPSKNNDGYSLA
ncbi:hypothetical protein II810_02330 [bacterium]|nr:hypothetical protein [bacterium]